MRSTRMFALGAAMLFGASGCGGDSGNATSPANSVAGGSGASGTGGSAGQSNAGHGGGETGGAATAGHTGIGGAMAAGGSGGTHAGAGGKAAGGIGGESAGGMGGNGLAGAGASGASGAGGSGESGGNAGMNGGAGGSSAGTGGSSVGAGGMMTCDPVTFLSDWIADPVSGGWKYVQLVDPNRMHLDGTMTSHGLPALRVEVDPGDDPLALGEDTERAEALAMKDASGTVLPENESSGTQYYATSYLFPSDWDGTELHGDDNSWSIVLQLHGPDEDGLSPAFSLSAARTDTGKPQMFAANVIGGDQSGCCGTAYPFSDGGLISLGSWTDLVFRFTFASTPTGSLTIWRRDQGMTQFTKVVDASSIATLQYNSQVDPTVGDHYWKQGLYRGGDVNGRTDVLWIGPTARGASFSAVECAAFQTADGPP